MRQVFTSARLENVEAVAKLLSDDGIEVRIQDGRSFRGGIRGDFSYRDGHASAARPSLWVVRTDDQTRARALLREHGLLQSPDRSGSFLGETPHTRPAADGSRAPSRGRSLLLAAVALLAVVAFFATRGTRPPAPDRDGGAAATVPDRSRFPDPGAPGGLAPIPPEVVPGVHAIAVPPALAATLFIAEARSGAPAGCLAIDGRDPPPATLAALRDAGLAVAAASACPADAVVLEVGPWRTDGSGRGTVELRRTDQPTRTLPVRRDRTLWHLESGT